MLSLEPQSGWRNTTGRAKPFFRMSKAFKPSNGQINNGLPIDYSGIILFMMTTM